LCGLQDFPRTMTRFPGIPTFRCEIQPLTTPFFSNDRTDLLPPMLNRLRCRPPDNFLHFRTGLFLYAFFFDYMPFIIPNTLLLLPLFISVGCFFGFDWTRRRGLHCFSPPASWSFRLPETCPLGQFSQPNGSSFFHRMHSSG